MKTLLITGCAMLLMVACKTNTGKTDTGTTATSENPNYPYTLDKPYMDWQPGDKNNVVITMKMVK